MSWYKKGKAVVQGFNRSLSNWEDSWWGGYEKVLWDYPEIQVNFKLDFENTGNTGLSWYQFRQLTKIFLLKVNEFKLSGKITYDVQSKEITDNYGRKKTRHTINQNMVHSVLADVISTEIELKNLFSHYQQVIQGTTFYYDEQPGNNNQNGSGQGKGQGGGGNNQGEDKKNDKDEDQEKQPSPEQVMEQMLNETVKRKSSYNYASGAGYDSGKTRFHMMSKTRECSYSREETTQAVHLSNLLDISFDPARDVINSLRTGKLDPRKICELPSGNFNIYTRTEEDQITRPFSVCFLGDESGSMDGGRIQMQRTVLKVLYRAFSEVLPPDKMFIYGHTSQSDIKCEVRVYNDKYNDTFEETINLMGSRYSGGTPCNLAINMVYNKVREFTEDNIIFLYMTDGGTGSNVNTLKQTVEKCRRDGFVTIGIGIQSPIIADVYDYSTNINQLDEMVRKISLIVNRVVKQEFQS